jgi:hypothetical protein
VIAGCFTPGVETPGSDDIAIKPNSIFRLSVPVRNHTCIDVQPAGPSRAAGLRVAASPRDGLENVDGFTSGTNAATALTSRTYHLIHAALEAAYGDDFINLPHRQRAVFVESALRLSG